MIYTLWPFAPSYNFSTFYSCRTKIRTVKFIICGSDLNEYYTYDECLVASKVPSNDDHSPSAVQTVKEEFIKAWMWWLILRWKVMNLIIPPLIFKRRKNWKLVWIISIKKILLTYKIKKNMKYSLFIESLLVVASLYSWPNISCATTIESWYELKLERNNLNKQMKAVMDFTLFPLLSEFFFYFSSTTTKDSRTSNGRNSSKRWTIDIKL